jgi:hypothetical protein
MSQMGAFVYSRRHFIKVAAASLALSQALEGEIKSRPDGVYIGLETFSLRALPRDGVLDALISAMVKVGLAECEIDSQHVEPDSSEAPDIREWRSSTPMDYFENVRKKFNRAGVSIYTYNPRMGGGGRGRGSARGTGAPSPARGDQAPSNNGAPASAPQPPITDEEIDRYFVMARALGAKNIASGLQPDLAKRVAPIAEKHKMVVAITSTNPDVANEILPLSAYFKIDIDIGDYTRAGHDSLQFVQSNYDRIADVHLKDCKLNGPSVPFGQGDSHMKEIMQLLKERKSQIRAYIDCDYPGTGSSVEEVKKCFDYVKACLA